MNTAVPLSPIWPFFLQIVVNYSFITYITLGRYINLNTFMKFATSYKRGLGAPLVNSTWRMDPALWPRFEHDKKNVNVKSVVIGLKKPVAFLVCLQCAGSWAGTSARCGYCRRSRWCSHSAGCRWRCSRCSSSSSRTWSSPRIYCTRCSRACTWWPCPPRARTRCCTAGWTLTSGGTYPAYAGRCGTAATRSHRPGGAGTHPWPPTTAARMTGGRAWGPRCRAGSIITTRRPPGCRSW